jgi:hypothetical protein
MFVLGTTQMILSLCTTAVSVRMVQALVEQDAVDALVRLWRVYFSIGVAQNIVFVVNKAVYLSYKSYVKTDNADVSYVSCVTDLLFVESGRADFCSQLYRC